MNKDSNYLKFCKNTFIITIIFLIVSFCAILCIQRVIDGGNYKGVESFVIDGDKNSNSNSNNNSNSDDNSNSNDNNSNSNKTEKSNTNSNKTSKSNSNKKSNNHSNKKSNKPSNNNPGSNGSGGKHQEEETPQSVDDGDVKYVVTKNKDIFENKYYDNKKIAPGVSGTYEFDVINNRKSKVKYKINTSNTNNSNINMEYRLKRDNEYVIGNESTWVKINNLNLTNVLLNSKSTHSYTLEWRWPYEGGIDNIDTEIGETDGAKYELKITVYAEEV